MSPQQLRHFFAEDDPTIAYPERITHAVSHVGGTEYFHLGCLGSVSPRDLEDYFVAKYPAKVTRTCAECGGPIHKAKKLSWDEEIATMHAYRKQIGGN